MLRSPQCGSRALISCLLSTTKAGKEHVANYQEKLVKLVWDDDVETGVQTGDAKLKAVQKTLHTRRFSLHFYCFLIEHINKKAQGF